MQDPIQVIRTYLKESARTFGLGDDLEIDVVFDRKERRSVKFYATQPNPAATSFIEQYPVLQDDWLNGKEPGAFMPVQIAEWKLKNARHGFVVKMDYDAMYYLERYARDGIIHPLLDDVVIQFYNQFMESLSSVTTEREYRDSAAASHPLPRFEEETIPATMTDDHWLLKVAQWLAWLTKPRVYDIPYKPKGIYPSTGEYVEDVEARRLQQKAETVIDLMNMQIGRD